MLAGGSGAAGGGWRQPVGRDGEASGEEEEDRRPRRARSPRLSDVTVSRLTSALPIVILCVTVYLECSRV